MTPAQSAGWLPVLELVGELGCTVAAELPAATTTVVPRLRAPLMAACVDVRHEPAPPSDMLITVAGVALAGTPATLPPDAHSIAASMSEE